IDDQTGNDEALPLSLRQLGHAVTVTRDAGRGLDMITELEPDLIFLGLNSAEERWPEDLAKITGHAPGIPVVPFGEEPSAETVCRAFRLGAGDALPLPLSAEESLPDTVARALRETCRRERRRQAWQRLEKRALAAEAETNRLENEITALRKELAMERDKRLAAEDIVRESRKTFQIMFQNTHDAIIHMNREGMVVNANGTLLDIFGLMPEEIIGNDLSSYEFLGADYMQAIELYKAARPDFPFPAFELEARHRDGTKIHIESQAKLILNQGEIDSIINIVRDITPQKSLEYAKNATILGLAKLAESRDDSTGQHLERVREYVKIITQTICLLPKYADYITPDYVKDIYLSSILHDIGKVSIPDDILLKRGPLTAPEFEIIKKHTIVGGNSLGAIDAQLDEQSFLKLGKEIAYYHHESWDGSGYPKGLRGEDIPLSARIVALADVYDALTTARVYKDAYSHEKAARIIMAERGKKFDPDIVDAFETNLNEFNRIRKKITSHVSLTADEGCLLNQKMFHDSVTEKQHDTGCRNYPADSS
ncbi:MAG: HD domain-containing phosphohydrolase, partial [Desulfosudaceae bacterium]